MNEDQIKFIELYNILSANPNMAPLCGRWTFVGGFWRKLLWYLRGKPKSMMTYTNGMFDIIKKNRKHDFKIDWTE